MPHNRKKAKEQGYRQGNGLWVDPSTDNGDREGHIKDYSVSSCWMSYKWYISKYAPYQPGDILYVRETWCKGSLNYHKEKYFYKADDNEFHCHWHPSIHMPKEAARIWLKVTDVRVERLQEITREQILREGANQCAINHYIKQMPEETEEWIEAAYKAEFQQLWNSTLKKSDLIRYGWDASPWVWVIEFERCEKPEGWCA